MSSYEVFFKQQLDMLLKDYQRDIAMEYGILIDELKTENSMLACSLVKLQGELIKCRDQLASQAPAAVKKNNQN
jgi:hypothetical protein